MVWCMVWYGVWCIVYSVETFSSHSEASATKLLENLEDMFLDTDKVCFFILVIIHLQKYN